MARDWPLAQRRRRQFSDWLESILAG